MDVSAPGRVVVPPRPASEAPMIPHVEVGAPCEHCATPIADSYFSVNGHATCPSCHGNLNGSFRNALALGLGATVLSIAFYHAVYWILHMRFVLVPVLAGVVVGAAVRKGAHASKLLRYRWLAVGLTYLAAIATYALAMAEMQTQTDPAQTLLHSLVLPFVMLVEGKNIVTLILLGFGLHEAWKFSAPPYANVEGPFSATSPQS